MEEGAAIAKFAFTGLNPVPAWLSLVIGVDGTQSCLTEVFWEWIVWLSQLFWSMSKLAVLVKWAVTVVQEMFAHLCLEFLFESVKLPLVAVKVVIVALLGQVSHHFSWWVVEVLLLAISIELSFLDLWLELGCGQ